VLMSSSSSYRKRCFQSHHTAYLLPVLKAGDIVIMDNLGSHKSAALRRVI